MNADLAHFMFANMRGSPSGKSRVRGPGYSGVAISGHCMVLATLALENGRLEVRRDCSERFSLEERDQELLRSLYREVRGFLREHEIRHVMLRGTSDTPKYASDPCAYAMESALKLIPGVDVDVVHRSTLDTWTKRYRYAVPFTPSDEPMATTKVFEMAIRAACFAASEMAEVLLADGS